MQQSLHMKREALCYVTVFIEEIGRTVFLFFLPLIRTFPGEVSFIFQVLRGV